MAEQKLVSLQEMQARFEHLKSDELEIACEMTLPVTISVYRGHIEEGEPPPLYCGIQFQGKEDASYTTKLLDPTGETAHTLEDVAEAFNIEMDTKIWEVVIEEEEESIDRPDSVELSDEDDLRREEFLRKAGYPDLSQEPVMRYCTSCGGHHYVVAGEWFCPLDPNKPLP